MPISPYLRSLRERVGHDLLLLPAVSAVIRDAQGRILLAQSHGDEQWALIGGGLEPGEEPIAAIAREIREELGVEATVGRIIGVYGCQRPLGIAHRRPAEVPAGGQWKCPFAARSSAHRVVVALAA